MLHKKQFATGSIYTHCNLRQTWHFILRLQTDYEQVVINKGSINEKLQCYTRSSLQLALKTDLKMFSALSYVTNYNCKCIFKCLLISSKKFPVYEKGTLRKHLHSMQFKTNMVFHIKIAD
jgi:hypothetical protein